MNPRPEDHILRQYPIARPKNDARMRKALSGVERFRLADVVQVLSGVFGGHPERRNAEPDPWRQRSLARRRARGRRQGQDEFSELRRHGWFAGEPGSRSCATPTLLLD